MSHFNAKASMVINAPPEKVYAVLSDYKQHHPAILPKPYFYRCALEQGGTGAETIIRVRMNVFGVSRDYRFVITEPEPGRVLMETDHDAGVVTTFTIDPLHNDADTRVTIATEAKTRSGPLGWIERLINPPITRSIFKKELENLRDYLRIFG